MIDDTLLEAEDKMEKAIEHVRDELAAIRTGRANPGMFNRVVCEYYGTLTPITQMATIAAPEPRMLIIKPYEMSQIGPIENAIRNSDLGVNPTNDGQVLRVTVPQLTVVGAFSAIALVVGMVVPANAVNMTLSAHDVGGLIMPG